MMEVEHLSYIFGSFARRRQSQDVSPTKRRSIQASPTKISHDRSKSAPHNTTKKVELPSPRAKSVCNNYGLDQTRFQCPLCRNLYIEPRVLPCLHTFCVVCLQRLEDKAMESDSESCHQSRTDFGGVDLRNTTSLTAINDQSTTITKGSTETGDRSTTVLVGARLISCPSCTTTCKLPSVDGIRGFPLNYLLQHRMVLATLNSRSTKLLCDLCTNDVTATSRCSECALSLCQECADNHGRQRNHIHHEVLRFEEARRRGITKVRRQIMCQSHPDNELSVFCSTCCQVLCRECFNDNHRNHKNESIPRAVKHYSTNIKLALNKTQFVADKTSNATSRLQETSKHIDTHCDHVQSEIDKFIESYIQAIEQHRKRLHREVNEARIEKLHRIDQHSIEVQRKLDDVRDLLIFADDLMKEGTDVEILSFVKPILRRLELCSKRNVPELKVSESLQFLPEEIAGDSWNSCSLYGVVTTQTVAPDHCTILPEGLQNLRVGKRCDIVLELRDRNDALLQRGGELVVVEVKHRETSSTKPLPVQIEDKKDGTYRIQFTPDIAGKYILLINVRNQPIKDNPFVLMVRPFRPHHGSFHCCCFCSSNGSKEASCGCGGRMPGGYKGCGHGHDGHPGRRHWSCCGNMLEHSECSRRNSTHYQFTL